MTGRGQVEWPAWKCSTASQIADWWLGITIFGVRGLSASLRIVFSSAPLSRLATVHSEKPKEFVDLVTAFCADGK